VKTLLSVLLVVLVIACGKPRSRCETNAGCFEGGKCGAGACAYACEEVGCLDGHFCDPDTNQCVAECPYPCDPPDHSTPTCDATCTFTCKPGYYTDALGTCPQCNVPDHCGSSCALCPKPENGSATCIADTCGIRCDTGSYDIGGTCALCNKTQHCGSTCEDCNKNGTLSGMICNAGGTACVAGQRFVLIMTTPNQPMVKDTERNLVWHGCPYGRSGDDCATGTETLTDWSTAKNDCAGLVWGDYATDWRLPSQANDTDGELSSLLIARFPNCPPPTTEACIDRVLFPNTPPRDFWSSTTDDSVSTLARNVNFFDGTISVHSKTYLFYVRCVHDP
jgi:hypothetical protein